MVSQRVVFIEQDDLSCDVAGIVVLASGLFIETPGLVFDEKVLFRDGKVGCDDPRDRFDGDEVVLFDAKVLSLDAKGISLETEVLLIDAKVISCEAEVVFRDPEVLVLVDEVIFTNRKEGSTNHDTDSSTKKAGRKDDEVLVVDATVVSLEAKVIS